MVDYLELARKARKPKSQFDSVADLRRTDPEAQRLLAAGWEPKERFGKTIWKRPDNGFYCSQEAAAHFLDSGLSNVECKSGADEER